MRDDLGDALPQRLRQHLRNVLDEIGQPDPIRRIADRRQQTQTHQAGYVIGQCLRGDAREEAEGLESFRATGDVGFQNLTYRRINGVVNLRHLGQGAGDAGDDRCVVAVAEKSDETLNERNSVAAAR